MLNANNIRHYISFFILLLFSFFFLFEKSTRDDIAAQEVHENSKFDLDMFCFHPYMATLSSIWDELTFTDWLSLNYA